MDYSRIRTGTTKVLEHGLHVLQRSCRVLVIQVLGSTTEPDINQLCDRVRVVIGGHAPFWSTAATNTLPLSDIGQLMVMASTIIGSAFRVAQQAKRYVLLPHGEGLLLCGVTYRTERNGAHCRGEGDLVECGLEEGLRTRIDMKPSVSC